MKLTDILSESSIVADLHADDKTAVLERLVEAVASTHPDIDRQEILAVLLEREELGSTGIGDGIAIPHGKSANLAQIISGFGLSKDGIDFDSLDGKPANLFFLLVAPEDSVGVHLKMLARISRMLKNSSFQEKLLQANSQQEIYQIISEEDAKY
ncbi:PTS fructose transporter subunit IIA [candidate division KSB3 bacterium]|uniref:PTS fructose transporter subunit IIA n=1 Tax=candidate division KSB3 bacterium TaxID=2044937 RepID=A0A2G6E8B2_9BACT|nr:MAG: PTS fructose transporter subunit IIA [candidate division KSB3 bacterium]PIE30385.1 MAG: PTS fructose transporter subunit IIA [candidate division KSB3 bacterium]